MFTSIVQLAALVCSLLALMTSTVTARPKRRLDTYISHYEELNYNTEPLAQEHARVKRETKGYNRFFGDPLEVSFSSHGKYFRLKLNPHHHVFHPDAKFIDGNGKPFPYDHSEFYSGKVIGDDLSSVAGTVANGKFHGVIQTKEDRFHIEPSRRYFDNPEFHSIVYKASDVEFSGDSCGASHELRHWMENMQNSGERQLNASYAKQAKEQEEHHHRQRRAPNSEYVECRIKIAGDHLFSQQVAKEEGIDLATDKTGVRSAVARVLGRYVMNVNLIYTTTNFIKSSDGNEGITFAIRTVQVYVLSSETSNSLGSGLSAQLVGVDRFLDLWSQRNLTDFCLAYLFTNRDFDNGVLGLAWVGSAGNSAGGVCDKYQRYSDGFMKTLNTGIVTTLNFGKQVAREVSYLTFAHELGHNMGSNHDPSTATCSPGGSAGNYIMYAHATSGSEPNNRMFSPCSRDQIGGVLQAKALRTDSCFELVSNGQICGNGVVDGNETCDCGNSQQCMENPQCCQPTGCILQTGMQCSPQQGPCCTSSCMLVQPSAGVNCTEENECRTGLGRCDGTKPECTLPPNRPDGTFCSEGTATCLNGFCRGSLCLGYQGISCFCSDPDNRCQVCCKLSANGTCTSLRAAGRNLTGIVTSQQPGAPCDDYEGFCDFFGFCRRLDDQGPIARLRNALFSTETINNAIEWSKQNWWAVALGVVGLVLIMVVIVHFLSKNTKKTVEAKREEAQKSRSGGRGTELNNRR
eukprot:scpid31570/ scgid26409/ Disintegrin and metalloproteinase domain-containing protein 10; CDw156; Kuzbanian protein homolog; Mammalian disintegrin-metalloprotease